MAAKYTEESIESLTPLEHIRRRPGMYIGRLGNGSHIDDGIYVLLKEIIDNSIDEFVMKYGTRILVTVLNNHVSVRDFGRGIPLGAVVDCVSKINTGAKYSGDAFQYSVGLNGVGTKAVNALSSEFCVTSYRDGKFVSASFVRGELKEEKHGKTEEPNGTFFEFTPDTEIFGEYSYNDEYVKQRLWNYAYLNTGLSIVYNRLTIKSQNGLMDLLEKELGEDTIYQPIHYKSDRLEFASPIRTAMGRTTFPTSTGSIHRMAERILRRSRKLC